MYIYCSLIASNLFILEGTKLSRINPDECIEELLRAVV